MIGADETTRACITAHEAAIQRLGRVETIALADAVPSSSAQFVVGEAVWRCRWPISSTSGRTPAARQEAGAGRRDRQAGKKLGNAQFLAKAPEEVVGAKARLAEAKARRAKIAEAPNG